MRKVYVSSRLVDVEMRKALLEVEGIRCVVKNQQGSSLAGEVPFAEVFPELWVMDEDYAQAVERVDQFDEREDVECPWSCPRCGESHGGAFTTCWNCGTERDEN